MFQVIEKIILPTEDIINLVQKLKTKTSIKCKLQLSFFTSNRFSSKLCKVTFFKTCLKINVENICLS